MGMNVSNANSPLHSSSESVGSQSEGSDHENVPSIQGLKDVKNEEISSLKEESAKTHKVVITDPLLLTGKRVLGSEESEHIKPQKTFPALLRK